MTKSAETETALALFPKLNLPSVTKIAEEMNASFKTMYTRLEADIADLPTDMSVKANREKVASYAYRISRTKTALDEAATGVSGDAKKIVDAVNAERKELKTTLDALRDKARAALNTWEAEEAAKAKAAAELLELYADLPLRAVMMTSEEVWNLTCDIVSHQHTPEAYGETAIEGLSEARRVAVSALEEMRTRKEREAAEAAELEQLRREKAEREAAEAARIAEEERKAKEAAEIARQDEERARIAKEAAEKAERDAAEAIENAKREQAAAEQRAKEAEEREAKRIEDEKRREADAIEAQKEAAARAEEDAKRREEKAKEDERQRLAKIAAEKERADQERAADIAHRKRLNGEAVAALMKVCGLSEKDAQAVIIAIYKEQVPHVAISY